MIPRILIIAGSDSGGGAGIQADIKTVTMLGGHAMTAITAITAQNTLGVQAVLPVSTAMVLEQMTSVYSDLGVDAIKVGMVGGAETTTAIADAARHYGVPIIFDPVMVATSGAALADQKTIEAFERLARIATLVTPNIPELAALCGRETIHDDLVELEGAQYAQIIGIPVLVKGGHGSGETIVDRLIIPSGEIVRWTSDRIDTTSTHGTGCTLSSAIATNLALGQPLETAIVGARQFVRLALRDAPSLGNGHGPMGHQSVRLDLGPGARLNQITLPTDDCAASCAFYAQLGLKQIVGTDDAHYARFEAAGGATLSVEAGARPTVFFECEHLDVEVARLQNAGVKFDQLPTDQSWLWREARLTDPSGNLVCLYQAGENRRYPPWRLD